MPARPCMQDTAECSARQLADVMDSIFDPGNLAKVSGLRGVEAVSPRAELSILVSPGGHIYATKFHGHDAVIREAMLIGGYCEGDPDFAEYMATYPERAGVAYVRISNGTLLAHGLSVITDGQKKAIRDICAYAHIADPYNIEVYDIENVQPRDLYCCQNGLEDAGDGA